MMKLPLLHAVLVLASMLPLAYSAACSTDADCAAEEAFCGRDGNCTEFSCHNWFKMGPEQYTGYDTTTDAQLTCADFDKGAELNANSIVFGCRPYSPGNKAPEPKTCTNFFNQECKASVSNGKEFKCYQHKQPGTNYQDYQGTCARSSIPSCDRDIHETEQPLYWYIKEAREETKDGTLVGEAYGKGRDNTANSVSFDASEANKAIFSLLAPEGASGSSGSGGEGGSSGTRAGFVLAAVVGFVSNLIMFWCL